MKEIFGDNKQKLSVSADALLRDTHLEGQFIIHGDMLDVQTSQIINPIIYVRSKRSSASGSGPKAWN